MLSNFSKFFHVNTVGAALLYKTIVAKKLPVKKVVVASSQFVYAEGRYECAQGGGVASRMARDPAKGQWDANLPEMRRSIGVDAAVAIAGNARESERPNTPSAKYSQELMAIALGRNYGIPSVALAVSIVQETRNSSFRNAYSRMLG